MITSRTSQFGRQTLTNFCDYSCPHFVSTLRLYSCNYYDALGIPRSSTQTEIKAAYYKLSMQFHPDRNQGSESAAKKFREITQAYQTLSNYKLRRLYDKGIIQTASGSRWTETVDLKEEPIVEDSPSTKFYKSRFTKSTVPDMDGRVPIYDFDSWSRNHYGKSFDRQKAAKEKHVRDVEFKASYESMREQEVALLVILIIALVFLTIFSRTNYDIPIRKREERKPDDDVN